MKKKIFVHAWGGLGDIVLSTPIYRQLKRDNPGSRLIVVSRSQARMEILRGNPYIDRLQPFGYWKRWLVRLGWLKVLDIQYGELNPSFCYKKKAAEVIAEMVGVTLEDTSLQIYLTEEEDNIARKTLSAYCSPVILHITSHTTENQMWPPERWNELVASMPEFTFLQLGTSQETLVEGVVDLRGKTNTRESMALVKHAQGFVGVVSFLSHVTGAFGTKGVILFGGVSAAPVWGHDCNINIVKPVPCSPCVDILMRAKCPYDRKCMQMITVLEVKEALLKQAIKQPVHQDVLQEGPDITT